MDLKESAAVAVAITLFLLIAGLLTGGIVFYGAAALLTLVLAIDLYLLYSLKKSLLKDLSIKRGLSISETYAGSPTQLICRLKYGGNKTIRLKVTQKLDDALKGTGDWAPVELTGGSSAYLKTTLSPAATGTFMIEPMDVAVTSWFFKDSFHMGKELTLSVYVSIGGNIHRSGHAGLRSKKSASIFGSTISRRGRGIDFLAIRRYVGGDSLKRIDWIRSSRMSDLMVREYEDEQPVPTFFIIDLDPSMGLGDGDNGIRSAIGLTAAMISHVHVNGERIGFNVFSRSEVVGFKRPAMGADHMYDLRKALSSLKPVEGEVAHDRHDHETLPFEMINVLGGDRQLDTFIDDTSKNYIANIRDDGFSRAVIGAMKALNTASRIVIITNLSMGMASLLNNVRLAKYYGHQVSVVLIPHVWHNDPELIEAEAKSALTTLRTYGIESMVMYPGETPEDVIKSGGLIGMRVVEGR